MSTRQKRELWLFKDWDNLSCSYALSLALRAAGVLLLVAAVVIYLLSTCK